MIYCTSSSLKPPKIMQVNKQLAIFSEVSLAVMLSGYLRWAGSNSLTSQAPLSGHQGGEERTVKWQQWIRAQWHSPRSWAPRGNSSVNPWTAVRWMRALLRALNPCSQPKLTVTQMLSVTLYQPSFSLQQMLELTPVPVGSRVLMEDNPQSSADAQAAAQSKAVHARVF